MDELDLLKKDWNKSENKSFPKLSYNDIYKMILKKSSSIVKWIFIISILEFVFWTLISFGFKGFEGFERFKDTDAEYIIKGLSVIGYLVIFYFFYLFFKNYKRISVTDNAKVLMETILKTRKTVRNYVAFNLIFTVISTCIVIVIEFNQDNRLIAKVNEAVANGNKLWFYMQFALITIAILAIAIVILLGFYYLIYGILLKRLDKNYKELKKMDL
ncbi:hypothetical protein [Formosa haliotis]|uniref:hypothetical protein n=1 Tax=Formosa haliotis TaxID=1555194 RepID=UPI000824E914|nr:hypothetical protein [Formosa haliotis]